MILFVSQALIPEVICILLLPPVELGYTSAQVVGASKNKYTSIIVMKPSHGNIMGVGSLFDFSILDFFLP
jgi:hypothetical protein